MLADLGRRLADRLAAERDQFVGAMKLEHADLADLELHQRVGRIAGQPGAHDAVLENIEGVDHRGHQARAPRHRRGPARDRVPPRHQRAITPLLSSAGSSTAGGGSGRPNGSWMAVPRPTLSLEMLSAMTRSAPSARATLTGTGLTIAPSNSQRPSILTGSNTPGKA